MKIQHILSTFFATAALTAPSFSSKRSLTGADNGTVILCTEANWLGECTSMEVALDETCYTLPVPFAYNFSSFEPTPGLDCYMQYSANCTDICKSPTGCNELIQFPGYADLSTYGPWNNTVGSIQCAPDGNWAGPF